MPLVLSERIHNTFAVTLTAAITSTTQSTISVSAAAPRWAQSGRFRVKIGDTDEICNVIAGSDTTTWTIVRGCEFKTKNASVPIGTAIRHVVTDVSLGSLVELQRPNIVNLAGGNPWGLKLRGVTPSAGVASGAIYGNMWSTNWSTALIDQQMNQAASVNANHVKGVGDSTPVRNGTISPSTYLNRIEYWLNAASDKGFWITFAAGISSGGTLAQDLPTAQQVAGLLDQYPKVVGIDAVNEINVWQLGRGGPGTFASSQPDATSLSWLQGPDSFIEGLRACTAKPIGCSFYVENSSALLANTSADWLYVLARACDYLDIHPYWASTTDMPLSVLQSLHALYPSLAVYFGEVSIANVGVTALAPEVKRRLESTRALIEQSYVPGATAYLLDDAETFSGVGYGIFGTDGVERPNMGGPLRTWPRNAGYLGGQSIPLVTPDTPFPLGPTLTPIPLGNFPLRTLYYTVSLGDPGYRIHAVVGAGVLAGDVIDLQVYDVDSLAILASTSVTVPTTGGPSTPDSSSIGTPGYIVGTPTPSTGTGKFGNGIVIANNTQQVQWANMFQPTGAQPFTVEFWFKRTRTGVAEFLMAQWGATVPTQSWITMIGSDNIPAALWIDSSGTQFYIGANPTTITDTTTFHHMALSFDGTTMRLYLDGVQQAGGFSPSGATSMQSTSSQIITLSGNAAGLSNPFFGTVDDVRISNVARYTGTTLTPPASAFISDANAMLLDHFETIAAASANITATAATEWQHVGSLFSINAGVKARNATAASPGRGAITSLSADFRYA
jgi:hypothetical protein